jgi:hypothetical protein
MCLAAICLANDDLLGICLASAWQTTSDVICQADAKQNVICQADCCQAHSNHTPSRYVNCQAHPKKLVLKHIFGIVHTLSHCLLKAFRGVSSTLVSLISGFCSVLLPFLPLEDGSSNS